MSVYVFLTHSLFAGFLFILACSICWLMVRRMRIMDVPNSRSSHDKPTPISGGIAIVATFIIGVIVVYFIGEETRIQEKYFLGFVLSAIIIICVSLYDDVSDKPLFIVKFGSQILAVAIVMYFGLVISEISIPGAGKVQLGLVGYVITFLWILGLTNAYNFMDGINGLAAGTAVIAGLFFCILNLVEGSGFVYIICYTLVAGSLGFMIFNFPRARLFMGDVGSAFLGFVFATLAIIAAFYDSSHTSLFVMPLLLFHFIYDTCFTFIHRLKLGENVVAAHRRHLYQLFNRIGFSHRTVSIFYFSVGIAQGIGASIMVQIEGDKRILVFIPFLIFQIIYSITIFRKARHAGLI